MAWAGQHGGDPAQVWAALLDTTQRAVLAGAVSSIDTRAESEVDEATGVEVRLPRSPPTINTPNLMPGGLCTVCVACGDDAEGQAAEERGRRGQQPGKGCEPVPAV